MDFEFKDKNLIELYETGKNKKYKFLTKNAYDNFIDNINHISSGITIFDWWQQPGISFEKLKNFDNRYSMRLDRKLRLEFTIDFEDKEKTKGYVTILTISKHYQK